MRSTIFPHRSIAVVVLILLLTGPLEDAQWRVARAAAAEQSSTVSAYPTTSWAMGVVVPEGAALLGGGRLRWEGLSNVTATVTLPNISMPDRIVYAVLSVMTSDGAVLQVAAGVRPNDSFWLAYSWIIPDVNSVPLAYRWLLNASGPKISPGANATLAIFRASGSWDAMVKDEGAGTSVRAFPLGPGATLKAGDQEVFSFESYSRLGATFHEMGNLTLRGLLLDGSRVVGGAYSYSEWDPSHTPLFVVGSSGTGPPAFISFGQAKDGSFVWDYETAWGKEESPWMTITEISAGLLLVSLCAVGAVLWITRKHALPPMRIEPQPRGEAMPLPAAGCFSNT